MKYLTYYENDEGESMWFHMKTFVAVLERNQLITLVLFLSWMTWENLLSFSVLCFILLDQIYGGSADCSPSSHTILWQFLVSQACYFRRYKIFSNFRNINWVQITLITISIYMQLYKRVFCCCFLHSLSRLIPTIKLCDG